MPDLKLLCAADLHIGRQPSRLPDSLPGGRISAASAWMALVERAIAEAVDAVLLAGDVVDQLNRSFEAYGPLDRGVRALAGEGIAVVAVAGNHDNETLHDVAREAGGGHLAVLGRGGRWERWTLRDADGAARLHVDGWSFPAGAHPDDPTAGYAPEAGDGVPVVGLLHGDLDQPGSPYAPVAASALRSFPVAAWVLGHIHVPGLHTAPGAAPILYPGSLQALDPGEPGWHGAWLMELGPDRAPAFREIPLSAVRYDTVDVDVEGMAEPGALKAEIVAALRRHLDELADASAGPLRVAHCRVRLTGRTALHGQLEAVLDRLDELDLTHEGGLRLAVDARPVIGTLPALDLEALAQGGDSPGRLARLLLELDDDQAAIDPALLDRLSRAAAGVAGRAHYRAAGLEQPDTGPGSPRVRAAARRQAARLLDALMAQKEPA